MDEDALRERLKQLVKERKETQVGLARLTGMDPTAFSKALAGKRRFTVNEAEILKKYLGVNEVDRSDREVLLPVVGLVSAGRWREGFETVIGWVPRPDRSLSKDAFVVQVEGDSMDKIAVEGEQVIVDPRDLDLIGGKYYVIRNAEGETTFKQFADNPARLVPCSTNADHQTILIGQEGFTVIGRVRKKVSDL